MFTASPVKTNLYGVGLVRSPAFPVLPRRLQHRVPLSRQVRAVISREEKAVDQEDEKSTNRSVVYSSSPAFPWQRSKYTGTKTVMAVVKIRKKMREKLTERLEHQFELLMKAVGQGMLIQLVSEEIDPETSSGRRSLETPVLGLPKARNDPRNLEFTATFTVPTDFGKPGAILVTNLLSSEICLSEIIIRDGSDTILFPGNTWIHSRNDNPEGRIIFRSQPCLPSHTPAGIKELREKDLRSVRGNGKGERKPHERIYDYDVYNDLGDPRKKDRVRPILGGQERPYPRRCRSGRPLVSRDPPCESRGKDKDEFYVPRDEEFEDIKRDTFTAGRLKALFHNLVPSIAAALSNLDIPFTCFSDIDKLYKCDIVLRPTEPKDTGLGGFFGGFVDGILNVGETLLKYDTPAVIKSDRFAWLRDNEFGRQALAGVNPVNIELLKELPIRSKLDPAVYGPQESALTEEVIAREVLHYGMTLEQAFEEKRLFLLDYHDMLLPFVDKINSIKEDPRKTYASRTIFFYSKAGALRPLAIELSLPPTPENDNKFVYVHGHDATTHWIWKLAKAHVCSNDAGVHQLVNHWLRTHASMEPYIIATNRQLSTMHPVYKLLHPHMRYTLEINARARKSLINGGGIIESCFTPGKYSMELSSAAYKSMWRFDMEGLPADLVRRGMAEEDASEECGVKLVIEDYPYAADGLLIWKAIKNLVESYVKHFYSDPKSIASDSELQAWWDEIKNKGHYDKKDEPWWPKLNTTQDLSEILTSMIWIASGQHAAINFGQYPFGGYVPNRPTLLRKLIPHENDPEYEMFMRNPQYSFLSSLPTQLQATKVMAVQENQTASSILNAKRDTTSKGGSHQKVETPEKLYRRQLREKRRERRANELVQQHNDDTILKLENAAIERSKSVDSAVLGKYSIWRRENENDNSDSNIRLMRDQVIMARVYSGLAKLKNKTELLQELQGRIKESQRVLGESTTDSDLPRSAHDKLRDMGQVLAKAKMQLYDCKLVTGKLRAMLQTADEQVRSLKKQSTFLAQLAAKTIPNAIHCLSMRLTIDYYLLSPEKRKFPRSENLENPNLYHYALFSDNVLAASVVVNSAIRNAKDPSKHVFHLVTDKLNFGAMNMWFLLNPPGKATIHVENVDEFKWLNSSYCPVLRQLESAAMKEFYFKADHPTSGSSNLKYRNPKYLSMLNHLRFYLPEVYPKLNKILFLDDDIIVQKDLTPLWEVNLNGKVNGAVETCGESFHRFDKYLNFSNPHIARNFNPNACGWAYGMNMFDLKEWKKRDITGIYHKWQNMNENRTLWKLGTLPPGLITFYGLTHPLNKAWHVLGLGYNPSIAKKDIENAAVVHYNGNMKPWLELAMSKYRPYWTKYIQFDHPYLRRCNLHE